MLVVLARLVRIHLAGVNRHASDHNVLAVVLGCSSFATSLRLCIVTRRLVCVGTLCVRQRLAHHLVHADAGEAMVVVMALGGIVAASTGW